MFKFNRAVNSRFERIHLNLFVADLLYFFNYLQVGDNLPFDSIYDSLINRIPPPPNQATQPVSMFHTCLIVICCTNMCT